MTKARKKAEPKKKSLEQHLWDAAVALRGSISPGDYKHVVLGLVFLKYVSDAFERKRVALVADLANPEHDDYLDDPAQRAAALEEVDYYLSDNVFWVPEEARWGYIQDRAKQPNLGRVIDDALLAIENENAPLKGVLNKVYSTTVTDALGSIVDLISELGFTDADAERDIFGQVYEYFLGNFALSEGQGAGEFFTTSSIVKVLVEVLAPHKGRVYDPCCGAGGMFVQSRKFNEAHGGRAGDISIYGQERNSTTWKLAAMNLAIRGMDFNLGKQADNTLLADQHPDQKFDYCLSNPPYNISKWGADQVQVDKRWTYGVPSDSNANFAWMQHILWHLKPSGQAGVVMANGTMSSSQNNEGAIRQAMVEDDVVEVMVALPNNLFFNTAISACLWFLCKDKRKHGRDRRGEVLFIDARKLGRMESRTLRVFDEEDIQRISRAVHLWRQDGEVERPSGQEPAAYADIAGFCRSVKREEIAANDYVLTPGRYVGTEESTEVEGEFEEKMKALTLVLASQLERGAALVDVIRSKLGGLGYAV
ncbi:N-6 DNA methylase [Paraburkholderia sp. UCT31]|uniref:type I restriction-modification system subunit M n=1 Tax=Paraburkholderia sp. UCT31 TaxID=2615209 RepID=UPI001654E639|nr:class I SAM-dependent DNA methyltransferase [Paraburkholderia sp. UCT31]MBC8737417.1 N-6 DNA methylase [Paraburkholderia sp. UCT31]